MLSENLPFWMSLPNRRSKRPSSAMQVTVTSDDGQSEILTGYYDRNYPTRFVYRSARLHGRTGGTLYAHGRLSGTNLHGRHDRPRTDPPAGTARRTGLRLALHAASLFDDPPAKNAYFAECRTTDPGAYSPCTDGRGRRLGARQRRFGDADRQPAAPIPQKSRITNSISGPARRSTSVSATSPPPTFDFWSRLENEMLNAMNPVFPAYENPSRRTSRATPAAFGADTAAPTTALRCHRKTIAKKRPFFRRHSSNEFVSARGLEQTIREIRRSSQKHTPADPSAPADGSDRPPFADAR